MENLEQILNNQHPRIIIQGLLFCLRCLIPFSIFSPFDKDDQISSSSTVSKRLLSNQSPPDTPSMREQVFYVSYITGETANLLKHTYV